MFGRRDDALFVVQRWIDPAFVGLIGIGRQCYLSFALDRSLGTPLGADCLERDLMIDGGRGVSMIVRALPRQSRPVIGAVATLSVALAIFLGIRSPAMAQGVVPFTLLYGTIATLRARKPGTPAA